MKTIQFLTIVIFTALNSFGHTIKTPILVKNNDVQVINAAIEHPDGSAYFFVGKYFHQYDTKAGKLKRMGLIGKDAWYGLPANIDAALIHPYNKKGYFFKGNQYHRYDFSKKKVDKTGILNSDGWKGIDGPIDAAIMHPTNNCAYFFKGKKYYRYNFAKNKIDKDGTIGVDAWKGMPARLNAAIMHRNGRAYGFKDDHYYRYVYGKKVDKKGIIGRNGWKIFHQLDAVVFNNLDNNFRTDDQHYIRHNYGYYTSVEYTYYTFYRDYKHPTTKRRFGYDWYKGVPPNVDAGYLNRQNEKYYFFKDDNYYRYNPKTKKVDKIAKIKDIFGLDSIDAAYGTGEGVFFFKGSKYFFSKYETPKVGNGGSIGAKFNGIPNELDAATFDGSSIIFYKKNVAYRYKLRKKISYGLLPSELFK